MGCKSADPHLDSHLIRIRAISPECDIDGVVVAGGGTMAVTGF